MTSFRRDVFAGEPTWRRRFAPAGLAFAGGLLAAAAHPPYGFLPGVFGYALILIALDGFHSAKPRRAAFLTGWAAGTGYLLLSTIWIVEPFLIDVAEHGWQAPFAVVLVAGGIGLFWGAAALLYRLLVPDPAAVGAWRVLVFVSGLGLCEWLRGHALTGFPWDLPGETFRAGSPLSQIAALGGAYGSTLLVLAVGAAPAVLAGREGERARLWTLGAAVAALATFGVWGELRLRSAPPTPPDAPIIRAVQPDLPEPPAWTEAVLREALTRYTTLTNAPPTAARAPDIVVWPEGAIPDSFNSYLASGAAPRALVTRSLKPGQTLLVGGLRVEPGPSGGFADGRYYNTLLALRRTDADLAFAGRYDKHHLVPFGEYMPFASLLGPLGLRKLVSVSADFTPGPPPRPLALAGGLIVQPLICYEALFPGLAAGDGRTRPRLLVNVSDDAWFGRHAGPWQHLNIASYRAIEEGLPMVRATPTGVSAMIDAYGRSQGGRLAPGAMGIIDAPLPPQVAATPYVRLRDGPFWLLVLTGLMSVALRTYGRKLGR
ncbi:apolipoprotein N-acyltransferase [soil metagenome]